MPGDLFDEAEGTRAEVMEATYSALRKHGYADLTIQGIADEFPKSKSLLYHHYEGKDEILLEFLDYLLTRYRETVPERDFDDAIDHLQGVVGYVVPLNMEEGQEDFTRAVIELRAQAANDERYHDHFTRSDQVFRERLREVLQQGVEDGAVRPVDPDAVADFVLTVFDGAMHRRVTAEVDVTRIRGEIQGYLEGLRRSGNDG